MEMTEFRTRVFCLVIAAIPLSPAVRAQQLRAPIQRPNILLLVADDMNQDTPGCFGGAAPDITPNIDALAKGGMRFEHAYVNISICTPSRSVMLSGLYPSRNGAEGFQRIRQGTRTLPAVLNEHGFLTGIIGKPLRQQDLFRWSVTYRWQGVGDEDQWGRAPETYRSFVRSFFAMSRASNQPFFLMASSHDPHRPFGGDQPKKPHQQMAPSSRTYDAEEVNLPGLLPDLSGVRKDFAGYCTSVRRLDDMVGTVLAELSKAGLDDETIVVFLADHGMPFPGVKFNCYPDSLKTPLIVRWPGKVRAGAVDADHMVSTVDLMPTLLDAVRLPPGNSDGKTFLPVLGGERQPGRDQVFGQFHHIHGKDALPMRCVLTKDSAYVFNPWSNGQREFRRLGGGAADAMKRASQDDPELAARLKHVRFRTVEEFFDLKSDPHCLQNLMVSDLRQHSPEQKRLAGLLEDWMTSINDSAVVAFQHRTNSDRLEAYVDAYRTRAAAEVEALKAYEKAQGFRF